MKLSFVLSSLSLSGGVRVVIEYANRLAARGNQVYLLAPGQTLAKDLGAEFSPKVSVIEAKTSLTEARTLWGKIRLTLELARLTPKTDAIIATHTPTTVVSFLAGTILKKGKPIWLYQDYPGMFQNRWLERMLLHRALAWHAGALTISEFSKKELEGFGHRRKVFFVGEGISRPELLHPLPVEVREQIKPPFPTIFFLGDMRPRKGMQDFLQAVDLVRTRKPNLFVWIASKDPCQIDSSTRYQFFERPDDRQLAKLYASCDVFVSASWWEGFGLPPLEAMACGAPVVTTDSQGVREFAMDGKNCLVVPPRNPVAMGEAILKLIEDPQLAQRFRENGPKTASRFTWEAAVDRFENALVELLK